MDNFTPIWDRIAAHAGSDFRQNTGRQFTYSLTGNAVIPSTTNRMLARAQFQKAYERSGPDAGPSGPVVPVRNSHRPRVATDS